MRTTRRIPGLSLLAGVVFMALACGGSAAGGPRFEVEFDSAMPRSARDQAVRVEVYLVDSCAGVTLGVRTVPSLASTYVLRDGDEGAFGEAFEPGDYGLYGVAQDADCAVVAAGCAPVTITGQDDTLGVTLGAFASAGCTADQACSFETGNCLDGTGGTGGVGGAGGTGGAGGEATARVGAGLILLYGFDEGSGSTVADQSGALPTHDLTIANPGNVAWSGSHLTVVADTTLSTIGAATKVHAGVRASGELTVEAWIKPANVTQGGPARIITMSPDPYLRNFMLGQEKDTYAARFRADGQTDWENGSPTLFTTPVTATLALRHVVHTHHSDGSEVFYVDGVANVTFARPGGTSMWDAAYPILVANEGTNDRAWLGELHLIAIYDRALDIGEVEQNFAAGP
jgi:hypothetical protein